MLPKQLHFEVRRLRPDDPAAQGLSFQEVHAQQPPRFRKTTSERPFTA
jgi:hypothetical protein